MNHRDTAPSPPALATAALAATTVVAAATRRPGGPGEATGRPAWPQVLAADGTKFDKKWGDFDILDARRHGRARRRSRTAPSASWPSGRTKLTAFLPTDRAFRDLATTLTGETARRPRRRRSTRSPTAAGIDVIETVLLYHVVPGQDAGRRARWSGRRQEADDRAGRQVTVKVDGQEGHRWSTPTPTCATRRSSRPTSTRATRRSRTRSTGCCCRSTSDLPRTPRDGCAPSRGVRVDNRSGPAYLT